MNNPKINCTQERKKSMLEQLQEAEKETKRQQKIEKVMEQIGQSLEKMGVKELEEITPDKIIKAAAEIMRRDIYKEYPSAEPKVVEALLLVYQNLFEDIAKEIESEDDAKVTSDLYMKEVERFATAMRKALKTMHS